MFTLSRLGVVLYIFHKKKDQFQIRFPFHIFRDDSSFNFMIFFFIFFFQMLVSIIYALGIGSMGSSGVWVGSAAIQEGGGGKIVVGALMVINGLGFALAALADFIMLVRVHKIYRSTGASIAKAQAEFTSGVMKNDTFRQAAAQAATDAAREGMRSQFGGGNNQQADGGPNNRY